MSRPCPRLSSCLDVEQQHLKGYRGQVTSAHLPHDDVDDIVAAWQREAPSLDVTPLHVLSRITRLARRLDLARGAAFADYHLEGWEFDVLSALRRAGDPYQLSPGQLVTDTLVTSGTMTNRVDRLEQKGLVRRIPDPTDRRGVRVRLTAQGRDVVDAALASLLDREREFLAGLSRQERADLAALLRRITTAIES
ncbi:MAG: MarR family transcriptional regulator [Dermatophilaceae bacterium]|jgi:DNA-binding MarR family transcriptional regulator|nr:MarR family transcriptional regulator [Actinomycetales bacterium]MBP8880154.1 MarR family transcriptional regulator [Dermatophilaceae bacterium]MBP9917612.1 MarR family transcriptional regulator [Dermatophilaceae bacterium]